MRARHLLVAAALLSLVGSGSAISAEPTAAGLWQSVDDETHQPSGWFLIREHDGVFEGAIVRMYMKPGESPERRVR